MAAKIPASTPLVGPFPGTQKPTQEGLFVRVSKKTGQKVWAYYTKSFGRAYWGLYADTKERALACKHKRSKKSLDWYGTTEAASTGSFRSRSRGATAAPARPVGRSLGVGTRAGRTRNV